MYKMQSAIIFKAIGWIDDVKACQQEIFLKEAIDVLQNLSGTERLNLNTLYNALDLRCGQKKFKIKIIWTPPCIKLQTVTEHKIRVHGKVNLTINFGNINYYQTAFVKMERPDGYSPAVDFLRLMHVLSEIHGKLLNNIQNTP
ncbi:hypothetical protein TNCV_4568401 [Trichonephila clavipes]|nr:hypothetical protein TNCV_4568401 [Trichonephila clavipes]